MAIPPEIITNHGLVALMMAVVKVNKVPFLVSISRVLKFGTANEMWDMKIDTLVLIVVRIVGIYQYRRLRVMQVITADGAFKKNSSITWGRLSTYVLRMSMNST